MHENGGSRRISLREPPNSMAPAKPSSAGGLGRGALRPAAKLRPRCARLAAVDAQAADATRIGIEDLDLEATGHGDQLAAHRDTADEAVNEAADGIDVLALVTDDEIGTDRRRDLIEIGAGIGDEDAVAIGDDHGAGILVIF